MFPLQTMRSITFFHQKITLKLLIVIYVLTLFFSLEVFPIDKPFVPNIQVGIARFSGKIEGIDQDTKELGSLNLHFLKVVTGDQANYVIPIRENGTFAISIPIQCITIGSIKSDYYNGLVCLIPDIETKMIIHFDALHKKNIEFDNQFGLTISEAINIPDTLFILGTGIKLEQITPEVYSEKTIARMFDVQKNIESSTQWSGAAKQILISEVKLLFIFYHLFHYTDYATNSHAELYKNDTSLNNFHPQNPDKSYYSFLKYFDLNNPLYLSSAFYPLVLQALLSNDVLSVPAIGDMPISTWLIKTKAILKDLIGTDSGLFYDLLVSNAYGKQFNEMKPLSETQKKNIASYFKNKSFVNILFTENERVINLANKNRNEHIFVFDKPVENLMNSIVSKYKGKVVFVDCWATWCSPCLNAMKESEIVRKEFDEKSVAFVYVTDPSSPRKAWEQKISEIHGDHYYITEDDWKIINKQYNFSGIPHYLIFDKSGQLQQNCKSFMGNKNMRRWISELL